MLGWDIFGMSSKKGLNCFSSTSDHYIISISFCYSTRNSQSYRLRWASTYQNKLGKSRTRKQSISLSDNSQKRTASIEPVLNYRGIKVSKWKQRIKDQ